MMLSKLIEVLNHIKFEHGNIPVGVLDDDSGDVFPFTKVEYSDEVNCAVLHTATTDV